MKIVRLIPVLALAMLAPALCGKVKDENFTPAVSGIPVTDDNGQAPVSMGIEGERYQTAVSGISHKEAKPKKQKEVEEAAVVKKIKKAKKVKEEAKPEIIKAKVGETFTIVLPASPELGRTWKVHKKLPAKVKLVGDKFVKGEEGAKYEGTMVYTFEALKPGKTTIHMKKIYPKEMKKPLKLKKFTIEVAK